MTTCIPMPPEASEPRCLRGAGFTRPNGLRAVTMKKLFDFAVGFSRQPLPKGNRFAIVTNAGGPGIMATDAAIRRGLELTTLRPETIESSKAKLPPTANLSSPVGLIAGTTQKRCKGTSSAVLADPDADGATALLAPRHAADGRGPQPNTSTIEDARVGFRKITNGVKQRAPGARRLDVEIGPPAAPPRG